MRKYLDKERPRGQCYDCGIPYSKFADLMISDDVWEKINPTHHEGAGLLCPNCIGLRLRKLSILDVPAVFTG